MGNAYFAFPSNFASFDFLVSSSRPSFPEQISPARWATHALCGPARKGRLGRWQPLWVYFYLLSRIFVLLRPQASPSRDVVIPKRCFGASRPLLVPGNVGGSTIETSPHWGVLRRSAQSLTQPRMMMPVPVQQAFHWRSFVPTAHLPTRATVSQPPPGCPSTSNRNRRQCLCSTSII